MVLGDWGTVQKHEGVGWLVESGVFWPLREINRKEQFPACESLHKSPWHRHMEKTPVYISKSLHSKGRELIPRSVVTMGAIRFPSTASIAVCLITVRGNKQDGQGLQHVKHSPSSCKRVSALIHYLESRQTFYRGRNVTAKCQPHTVLHINFA